MRPVRPGAVRKRKAYSHHAGWRRMPRRAGAGDHRVGTAELFPSPDQRAEGEGAVPDPGKESCGEAAWRAAAAFGREA